jgi:hypothetical protein
MSPLPDGRIAQLVEQLTLNQRVLGSSPSAPTTLRDCGQPMSVENGTIRVLAEWDAEASVWTATSDDLPGLVSEGETLDQLIERVVAIVPDLLMTDTIARQSETHSHRRDMRVVFHTDRQVALHA